MSADNKKTFATRFLDQHPEIRNTVKGSPDFSSWKGQFPEITIDGILFYLSGGPAHPNPGADQLQEEDELILQWARMIKLISEDDIRQFG